MNTETITAEALTYNSDYPEAAAEILAGIPTIRVHLEDEGKSYRNVRAVVAAGVVAVDGGWIGAGEPVVKTLRRTDGRLSKTELAKRAAKFLGLAGVTVPVVFIEHGI